MDFGSGDENGEENTGRMLKIRVKQVKFIIKL